MDVGANLTRYQMNADLEGVYPHATVTNHILQKATSGILPDPNGWWMSAAAQQVRRRLTDFWVRCPLTPVLFDVRGECLVGSPTALPFMFGFLFQFVVIVRRALSYLCGELAHSTRIRSGCGFPGREKFSLRSRFVGQSFMWLWQCRADSNVHVRFVKN